MKGFGSKKNTGRITAKASGGKLNVRRSAKGINRKNAGV